MTLKEAAIHYAQVVDEVMDRRFEWLQENEPEWLQHMAVARMQLLTYTGDAVIRKEVRKALTVHKAGKPE